MTEHGELLAEARKLATELCPIMGIPFPDGRPGGTLVYPLPKAKTLSECAKAIDTLTDIVARQDRIKAHQQKALEQLRDTVGRQLQELRAARHLIRNAAKLGKPEGGDKMPSTLPDLVERTFAALRTPGPLAVGVAKLTDSPLPLGVTDMPDRTSPSAPPVALEMCVREIGEGAFQRGYWIAYPKGLLVTLSSNREATRKAGDEWLKSLKIVKPVEVEMRLDGHTHGGLTWQCCLMGIWVTAHCYSDNANAYLTFAEAMPARESGNAWLAALSNQLGVKLVAVWEGESQAKTNTIVCSRCHNEFDSTKTGLAAPMWPGCCGPCNCKQADDFASRHP